MSSFPFLAIRWHQQRISLDMRERVLAKLALDRTSVALATCHRVELYALSGDADMAQLGRAHGLDDQAVASAHVEFGERALAHLFRVSAGLDSSIAGETQVLAQVRRASTRRSIDPALVAIFARALHVGRSVRHEFGFGSARSVGSLAVDRVICELESNGAAAAHAAVLVIGAGEMGNLAVRALARRVGHVVVANRDLARAHALAAAHGATAIGIHDVAHALGRVDAVISAADTRGALLTADVLGERVASSRAFFVADIAVPRSIAADGRAVLGSRYASVDELPGALSRVPPSTLDAAVARCDHEAERFVRERAPDLVRAIRDLRDGAEAIRQQKLERALRRLGHLDPRDRHVIELFSTRLTNALLHAPTVALRERADRRSPEGVRR